MSRFWTAWWQTLVDSRTGKFRPESRLPILQISFIYRKQRKGKPVSNGSGGWLSRNGTRISDWNIPFEKTGLPIQMFRCFGEIFSENFRWTTQNWLCTIYFPTGFSRIFLEMVNDHYLKWISPTGTVEPWIPFFNCRWCHVWVSCSYSCVL